MAIVPIKNVNEVGSKIFAIHLRIKKKIKLPCHKMQLESVTEERSENFAIYLRIKKKIKLLLSLHVQKIMRV